MRAFELDADRFLFNAADGGLFILNATAAVIWDGLGSGSNIEEIASGIAQETGIDPQQVLEDCRTQIEQWAAAGLLAGTESANRNWDSPAASEPLLVPPPLAAFEPLEIEPAGLREGWYRIADFRFRLTGNDRAFGLLAGFIDHCESSPGSTDEHPSINLVEGKIGWALFVDEIHLTHCDQDPRLAPMLHAALLHSSYAASESRLFIHGAAVFRRDECILLPGKPGAGKSTLMAALVTAGFGYCTDDFTILSGDPLRLRGMPLSIGLKQGSWPLLENLIPAIKDLPIHLREDGQSVRYLPPPIDQLPGSQDDRFRVVAMVFPEISLGEKCRIEPMARSSALLQIAESGYHLMGDLDEVTVEALVAWLRTVECYTMHYSDLDAAVAAIDELLT